MLVELNLLDSLFFVLRCGRMCFRRRMSESVWHCDWMHQLGVSAARAQVDARWTAWFNDSCDAVSPDVFPHLHL